MRPYQHAFNRTNILILSLSTPMPLYFLHTIVPISNLLYPGFPLRLSQPLHLIIPITELENRQNLSQNCISILFFNVYFKPYILKKLSILISALVNILL